MSHKMTPIEQRAALSLASILSLRMLGLFMILPVFSLYTSTLQDTTPTLMGIAMGIYGLSQAVLQIPFGMLSDHYGRRRIIAIGLCLFILGSIIAATSHSIYWIILGRTLQGAGAVGSTIIALLADLTREEQRTKAMAIAGMTIGASFALAMMLGPLFAKWFNLFWLAAMLGILAIVVLYSWVPTPISLTFHPETETEPKQFLALLKQSELLRLNSGIFLLHAVLTASFIVLPLSLQNVAGLAHDQQWQLFLPTLLLAFILSVPFLLLAERKRQVKRYFLASILVLVISELLFWLFSYHLLLSALSLLLFFTAFSLLEAFLPSLISRTAHRTRKGTALGIYSSSQFLGIFVGGTLGGWLYGAFGPTNVYLFCAALMVIWFAIAFGMKKPQYSSQK